jgi:endonuclease YncB( thermonuclease family)
MDCCCNNKLKNIKNEDINIFSFEGYKCKAKVVSVYDGDTFTACFKYRGNIIKYKFRTFGYDSPEMKPLKSKPNREEEKKKAIIARYKFKEIIKFDSKELVELEMLGFDKYGRILVNVFKDHVNINEWMIKNKYGYSYFGGTKRT